MRLLRIVALVSGIAKDALKRDADLPLDLGDDGAERMPIIGLPGKALAWTMNWPPFEWLSVEATETFTPNS